MKALKIFNNFDSTSLNWSINFCFIIVCFLTLTFTSCEHVYNYTYLIENESDSEVIIVFSNARMDSTFTVGIGEKVALYSTHHGEESSGGPFKKDVTVDIDVIMVRSNSGLISSKDYLDNAAWSFQNGVYTAVIETSDFK
ncbi:hypothetical protein EYV94_01935 [Puteibacter caeruleilacunae]|nr:hypothetical protein EYV94_01935 [Puteibacter caeruleilacunae]